MDSNKAFILTSGLTFRLNSCQRSVLPYGLLGEYDIFLIHVAKFGYEPLGVTSGVPLVYAIIFCVLS